MSSSSSTPRDGESRSSDPDWPSSTAKSHPLDNARLIAPGDARPPRAIRHDALLGKNELRASIQAPAPPLAVMVEEAAVTPSGLTMSYIARPTAAPQDTHGGPFPLVRTI
jgi:hypothetical protein